VPADLEHDESFSVVTAPAPGAVVVSVAGQADLHTAPELRDALAQAIDVGERRIVVDLTEATFVDSMTLGVLLGARRRVAEQDGGLAIVCPDPHLRRVFEITSLDRVFSMTASLDEAFASLGAAGNAA
jgi:anti-sigma B factor antagonist